MNKTILHREFIRQSTVGGEFSVNTQKLEGICKQIIVTPETSTTEYLLSITDDQDAVVYDTDTETGGISPLTDLPLRGVYTVKISNATSNESFLVQLIVEV